MSAGAAASTVAAFDALAERYDGLFTDSLIGRAQRDAVWRVADRLFLPGMHLLELNCGTGEDAVHFASRGIRVTACDASARMISVARRRASAAPEQAPVNFQQLAIEDVEVFHREQFDAVFSNFSGLNCVADLRGPARALAAILPPGAPALLCLSSRVCAWEFLWFAVRGDLKRAMRRWKGSSAAVVGNHTVDVRYPTVSRVCRELAPWFELQRVHGIGVAVPPSYAEAAARRHRRALSVLKRADLLLADAPVFCSLGDHVLLEFGRAS